MLQFQYVHLLYLLLLLIPLTALLIYTIRWKQKIKKQLGNQQLIGYLIRNYSSKKFVQKNIITLITIGLLIMAMANLRKPLMNNDANVTNGVDIVIALDVSKSMLSEDEKPNRLEKAKQLIYALTNQLQGNRIGLVVFAGKAYLQMPLTADVGAIKMFVGNANTQLINTQGTVIGEALQLCNNSLNTQEKKYKAAILITDGEDHDNTALDAVKKLSEKGVILHTIGVGSVEGVPIKESATNDYKRDENGQTIISQLNEPLLQSLAQSSGGNYYQLKNVNVVANDLFTEINGMNKKSIHSSGGYVQYQSFYFIFVSIAILLLLVEFFMSEKKRVLA